MFVPSVLSLRKQIPTDVRDRQLVLEELNHHLQNSSDPAIHALQEGLEDPKLVRLQSSRDPVRHEALFTYCARTGF